MEPGAIQIQRKGLTIDEAQIDKLRTEFHDAHWVRLPQLLDPSILYFLHARLKNAKWQTKTHDQIGEEYVCTDLAALGLLHFAASRPKFRALIEEITDCKPLRSFSGRVYRVVAGAGHYDRWHDDVANYNEVAMSLNLSPNLFRGGLFMLRERASARVLAQVANTGFGDALIFRISPSLQHRTSDIEGAEPKTAYAGWFRTNPPDSFRDSNV